MAQNAFEVTMVTFDHTKNHGKYLIRIIELMQGVV